jgi:hypothetical protein
MNTVDRVARAIRQNPEGLLLLGAGVALMLRHAASSGNPKPRRKSRMGSASDRHSENVGTDRRESEGLASKVSTAAEDARSYVADTANDLAGKASDLADKASEYGHAATRRTRQAADSAYRSVEGVIETHPVSIAIAGLAAGCLAAAIFPATRIERETLGPLGRRAADAASEAGEIVKSVAVERVTSAAFKAGEHLKDAVSEGKFDTETLGQVARNVASDFKTNLTGGDSEAGEARPDKRMAKAQL